MNSVTNPACHKHCNADKRASVTENEICGIASSVIDGLPLRCVGKWAYEKINLLLKYFGAFIKFLSLEPLLSSLGDIDLREIDWVIVGGESGPDARPMEKSWVVEIQNRCKKSQIPFFFKQWGGVNKKAAGSMLEGKYYKEMPICLHTLAI